MTLPHDFHGPSKLETTPLGGGGSARLIALAVVAVLGTVVVIGLSGRSAAPAATPPRSPLLIAETTATPELAPTTPELAPSLGAPKGTLDADEVESLYAEVMVGDRAYATLLKQVNAQKLAGTIRLPVPPEAATGTISISRFSTSRLPDSLARLGRWDLALDPLAEASRDRHRLLGLTVHAQTRTTTRMIRADPAFVLAVYAQNELLFGVLTVEFEWQKRNWLRGDDGILSLPAGALPTVPPKGYKPGVFLNPHHRDNGNQCRWFSETPGVDEADCQSSPTR